MVSHPNSFYGSALIQFALPRAASVRITVVNTLRQEVTTPWEGWKEAGSHQVAFDASDLPVGIYFYGVHAGNSTRMGRMVLLR